MKLRIKGNSIRLRLSRTEVDDFAAKGRVEDTIQFTPQQRLTYTLLLEDGSSEPAASFAEDEIRVLIPENIGRTWAGSEQVGIEHRSMSAGAGELKILVEKDFQCLTERPDEDESDNFPHPVGEHKNC